IIIGGSALGSMLVANPLNVVMQTFQSVLGLLKGNPYTQPRYMELLQMLYDMFMMARREGLVTLDQHVERPQDSKFFANYPFFFGNHHALSFLADTMKVIITGSVADHNLAEMMDVDLEVSHEEMNRSVTIISKVGDAM